MSPEVRLQIRMVCSGIAIVATSAKSFAASFMFFQVARGHMGLSARHGSV